MQTLTLLSLFSIALGAQGLAVPRLDTTPIDIRSADPQWEGYPDKTVEEPAATSNIAWSPKVKRSADPPSRQPDAEPITGPPPGSKRQSDIEAPHTGKIVQRSAESPTEEPEAVVARGWSGNVPGGDTDSKSLIEAPHTGVVANGPTRRSLIDG